jgi:hypothetical protein
LWENNESGENIEVNDYECDGLYFNSELCSSNILNLGITIKYTFQILTLLNKYLDGCQFNYIKYVFYDFI